MHRALTLRSADEVRLTLEGAVQHPAMIRFLERVGADKVNAFSTYDFLVLDRLHRDIPLSDELRTRLPSLVAAGAVETIGRARGPEEHAPKIAPEIR